MRKQLVTAVLCSLLMVFTIGAVAEAAADKDIEWCFTFTDGFDECGTATANDTEINSMTVHVSCSAVFDENGYSSKGQPVEGSGDPAIVKYSITHYKDSDGTRTVDKTCGETFSELPADVQGQGQQQQPAAQPASPRRSNVAGDSLPRTGPTEDRALLILALSLIGAGFAFGLPTSLTAVLKRR